MEVKLDHTYWIRNGVTNQYSQFLVSQLREYQGHLVVGGVLSRHQIRVVRGVQDVIERFSAFAILRGVPDQGVELFTRYVKGLPLSLCDHPGPALAREPYVGDEVRIVNTSRSAWGPRDGSTRASRLARCRLAIDLYLYMAEHGLPPKWYLELRAA